MQRRRVALLALLALAGNRGVSRDKILGYLWGENDIEHARSLLNVAVYALRKALGEQAIISDAEGLHINTSLIRSDVPDFETALERDDAAAVALHSAPFLDGFYIAGATEFERWVERERDRLGRLYCGALERLAEQSEREGNFDRAAEWWKSRAAHDPYDSRVAIRLMQALDAGGNSAAALQHALIHGRRLKEDFDVEPSADVKNAAEIIRSRRAAVERGGFARDASRRQSAPGDHRAPAPVAVPAATDARILDDPAVSAPTTITHASDLPEHHPATLVDVGSPRKSRNIRMLWQYRRYAVAVGILIVAVSVAGFGLFNHSPKETGSLPNPTRHSSPIAFASDGQPRRSARHEAEDLYYQGRYLTTSTQNVNGFAEALALYTKAAELDPTFAKAYAGMADAYNYMDNPRQAKAAALKALSLDSTMAEALNALAYVYGFYEHRWLAADSAAERATRLSPRFTLAHLRRANINAALGRADVAFASLEKARAIEPESWTVLYNRGFVAAALGMNEEAIKHLEAALALEPNRKGVRAQLAWQYWGVGRKEDAAALLRSLGDATDAAMLSGDSSKLRALIQRFETDSTTLPACQAAAVYLELGEKDSAFKQLKRSVGQNRLLALALRTPPFVSVKEDPRYGELKSELGIR